MTNPLTVIIPCKDEEANIRECIESVRPVADEILVADSGSTDRTLEIVRAMGGCRIIEREYVSPGDFKNWALPQAAHRWVLAVDADERLTDELAAEIRALLSGSPACDAYRVRFDPYFLGRRIRRCGWNTTSPIRLFRRDVCRYDNRRVHEDMVVQTGRVGMLEGKFLHFTCRSLGRWLEKQNRYTTWAAEEMHAAGRRVGYLGLVLRPLGRFLKSYLVRGGFLDGVAGLIVCVDAAVYAFLKYAKLWVLNRAAEAAGKEEAIRPGASGMYVVVRHPDPTALPEAGVPTAVEDRQPVV